MVHAAIDEREWQTRRQRIDPRVIAAGWAPRPCREHDLFGSSGRLALTEYPTDAGPADYALTVDGKVLGIVEAKRVGVAPQESLPQAERYARAMARNPFDFAGLKVPFLYSTNGEQIWFHDVRHPLNRSRKVAGFHTPDALGELLNRDLEAACQGLEGLVNNHERLRPYQIEANAAIEQAVAARKRRMLVAMATGTGKTFTMVNEAYRLMKSGAARRILFLVDRRALAAQAVRAFASFEPEPGLKFNQIYEVYSQRFRREDIADEPFDPNVLPTSYLLQPHAGLAFVYVSTIQRMAINVLGRNAIFGSGDEEIDEDADRLDIPIHAFDLVIADECHRGYTAQELSVWRNTLDHFDATTIGLTATPAAHTTSYFKDIVYRYDYERAVREGFLVDYDVVAVRSDVRMNGVFLDEGEQVGVVDPTTGAEQLDLLEDDRRFEAPEVERRVTSPDSNRRIVEEIKKYAIEHERETGRFPKTLIFAANDLPHVSHADQLVDTCRDAFGMGDAFVAKITGRVDRPLQRIREFRNRPQPAIVVSVDLMSTGVDIPDLEFIVLLRQVRSRILFEQMVGRGTRKGDRFPDKSHFVVFDCFGGTLVEYFRKATAITAEPPERAARTIVEIIEDVWSNRDREYNIRCLVKRLQRIDKEMSAEARQLFAAYVPAGDMARFARELPSDLREDFVGTMKLLRDKGFQDLLQNFPRARTGFMVAYEAVDEVSSEWRIRVADGRELKPEDYLAAFARFVRENPEHIAAIEILLDRPAAWGTDALEELRAKLARARNWFDEATLRRAHQVQYHKALVDIISMVKHAASEESPLLTADERVERAMRTLREGREFSHEQRLWLARIQAHLVENLSIGQDDFDIVPVLAREGGWVRANRAFDGRLGQLLHTLNGAIAA